ncbi:MULTISPECIES: lytic transglycosylase domain-containing protein [unclassified Polynucleobacter]|jgi:soluble lytic murein transglycosylase|uniref:lytic transglycosylase domain-containing protein n=1 Tax=unclassified Polynucleobacter TaxID=2640945 RepID=UPI00092953E1|nr:MULTISPECIES: lytic transglycosylase domain-containing protein [unclassified Polynucleobacter]MEA9567954.1 transglycosylase SLT domain-containing protein [Polynucleobacter sp. AP-Nickl1-40-C4]OJI05208.1 lytic transglycosylase [Polynucleobacter sp. MWH-Adler-W8]
MKFVTVNSKYLEWAKILVLGLALGASNSYAEKLKKPSLPKSYESKAAPAEITDTDRMFVDLREAAKKNDVFRTQQLSSNLVNYPFDDYVAYFRIKPQLFDSAGGARNDYGADAQVVAFLNQYQGTALADRMRNDWLLVLGKRRDWARFDVEYAKFVLDDDTQVKCYSLLSKLSQGENPTKLAIDSRAVLLDPSYFGQACQELVPSLVAAGGMSPSEAKAIGRAASERGYDTMARRLGGEDPIADIVKAVKADPSKAYRDFSQNASRYSKENQAVAWGVIGQFLAKKLDPNADDAYRLQQELGYNELLSVESQEWKVRAGLRAKDWALVKNAIDGMNPAVRAKDPAWTYWYGRALKAEGQDAKAKDSFEIIADQYNFYGQLAREELGKSNNAPAKTKVTEQEIDAMASRKGFIRGERLYSMNLRFEGNREWNWELRNMTDKQLLAAAEYAKRINLYDRVVNTADRTKQEHDFSLRYPTPYKEELSPIARQIDLNLAWAYGLIRQESRFIMNAASSVGASGLMQVMPNTAKYVAKKIGMPNYTNDKLSDMNTNLTLGSNYLNMVLIDLDGSWVLASAAYNAGPSRSKAWREKLSGPTEGAIFAETIPFTETRVYVKNVLSNANYYSSVMSGQPQSLKQRLGVITPKAATQSELP